MFGFYLYWCRSYPNFGNKQFHLKDTLQMNMQVVHSHLPNRGVSGATKWHRKIQCNSFQLRPGGGVPGRHSSQLSALHSFMNFLKE